MSGRSFFSRRGFLGVAGGVIATSTLAGRVAAEAISSPPAPASGTNVSVPFYGIHQAGIDTPRQSYIVFAALDLVTDQVSEVIRLLQTWTEAGCRLTSGGTAESLTDDPAKAPRDSGETLGMTSGRLTLTFGFGPGLFEKQGWDRYGLKARRPAALVDLPRFNGEQLDVERSGGDLSIQACADDGAVAFHAVRQLVRMAAPDDAANGYGGKKPGATAAYDAKPGVAVLRWMQTGFLPEIPNSETPRNLLGFKDGTHNPGRLYNAERAGGNLIDNGTFDEVVWVGDDGPDWMRNGSYVIVRRIRLALEHWDRTELDFQEEVIGRKKASGAPVTGGDEFAPLDLDAMDSEGNPVIAENAHVRLGAASSNDGARILRRSYSYNDGLSMVAERWPPWRQGLEYDAGLLFIAYQRDPRAGFIKIFERMSKLDLVNQYSTHVGSGIFACPGGIANDEFIGQSLFASL